MENKPKTQSQMTAVSEREMKSMIKLQKENQSLQEKVEHLETMMKALVPIAEKKKEQGQKIEPEESICHLEISKLLLHSLVRELDLNECKKLDILIKNLYIIQGKELPAPKKTPKKVSASTLITLAKGTQDDGPSQSIDE